MASSSRLLQLAIPLVKTHGFSREALARSVLALPVPHAEPLSETSVSALFGHGEDARRTLISAWMDDGLQQMNAVQSSPVTVKSVLHARLKRNEPVLQYLPEAFALLASPALGIPPLDPLPVLKHVSKIAHQACHITGDSSLHLSWYARRAALSAAYGAAELHQLTSPQTAYAFLDSLLDTSSAMKSSLDEAELFAGYIKKSWEGIIKSSGAF